MTACLCPCCSGDGKCALCSGHGVLAQSLADLHVETTNANVRLATRNVELMAALKAIWEVLQPHVEDMETFGPKESREACQLVRDALGVQS